MQVRAMTEEDFIQVSNWLSIRKWPMPPTEASLPDSAFVCYDDNGLLAAAWAYNTNADIIMLSWMCTPPDSDKDGMAGLVEIAKYVRDIDRTDSAIMFMTTSERLAKYLSKEFRGTKPRSCYNTFWTKGDK